MNTANPNLRTTLLIRTLVFLLLCIASLSAHAQAIVEAPPAGPHPGSDSPPNDPLVPNGPSFPATPDGSNEVSFVVSHGDTAPTTLDSADSPVSPGGTQASHPVLTQTDAPSYYYYDGKKAYLTTDSTSPLDSVSLRQNGIRILYFHTEDNAVDSIGISNIFYVKLKNKNDFNLLKQVAGQKNVSIIYELDFLPLWYRLEINSDSIKSSLQVCNEFYETGYFKDVDPSFLLNIKLDCANDPEFPLLWGLKNSVNPAIDINACKAWRITEGSNVVVAVIDGGVDKTHNDLNDNINTLSLDAESKTSPSIFTAGAEAEHGTHVAGTITAEKDNALQVVGVAPKSSLMVISHPFPIVLRKDEVKAMNEQLAYGIFWAWQNGAHVINNSWVGGLWCATIKNAVSDAITKGRNGLGTVVVFATGNAGNDNVSFPANSNDAILTVGAINRLGKRADFSNYGEKLDVVAPGVGILSTLPDQKTGLDTGTSMAAPHVAGIAALMLSVNPYLTAREVNDIIEGTAQKVGGYAYVTRTDRPNGTWNREMGYGLVDAYAAVQKVLDKLNSMTLSISSGPTCEGGWLEATVRLNHNDKNYPIVWQVPSGVNILDKGNQSVDVRWPASMGSIDVTAKMGDGKYFSRTKTVKFAPAGPLDISLSSNDNNPIYKNSWNVINAYYKGAIDGGTSGYTWHWSASGALMRMNNSKTSTILLFPNESTVGSIYVQVRAETGKGSGCRTTWVGDWFKIIGGNSGGVHNGGIP